MLDSLCEILNWMNLGEAIGGIISQGSTPDPRNKPKGNTIFPEDTIFAYRDADGCAVCVAWEDSRLIGYNRFGSAPFMCQVARPWYGKIEFEVGNGAISAVMDELFLSVALPPDTKFRLTQMMKNNGREKCVRAFSNWARNVKEI